MCSNSTPAQGSRPERPSNTRDISGVTLSKRRRRLPCVSSPHHNPELFLYLLQHLACILCLSDPVSVLSSEGLKCPSERRIGNDSTPNSSKISQLGDQRAARCKTGSHSPPENDDQFYAHQPLRGAVDQRAQKIRVIAPDDQARKVDHDLSHRALLRFHRSLNKPKLRRSTVAVSPAARCATSEASRAAPSTI
ncbi:hypothetical protein AXZ77_0682 [Thioclava sp. ES.031]|nr:hypothetical protein AXZ77_0682 [Thioclava sp. ES.031]